MDFTDRRARVWRMRNERFAEVCIAEHDRCGRGSVMVWAGISTQGKTDLHVIDNGTLTAESYVISSRQVQPATVRELREALIEEWAQLPQHKLRRLIRSMRRRCQAVINAHGHHTHY